MSVYTKMRVAQCDKDNCLPTPLPDAMGQPGKAAKHSVGKARINTALNQGGKYSGMGNPYQYIGKTLKQSSK